jgi:hypothetical protein
VILVRLTHDFIRNAMLAAIIDCFFFGHNAIVVRVPLFEIRQARGIAFHSQQIAASSTRSRSAAMFWLRDSRCFGLGAIHHFPDECLETRIAAQRFESSVDLDAAVDPGVEGRAIFVAFFQ